MADPLGGYVPDTVKNDEPIREPIARLGKMISDRMEVMLGKEKITKESPEYWGLAPICTDEQALIAIKMGKRKPRTFAQIKKLTKINDDEYLQKQLDEMSNNGLIESTARETVRFTYVCSRKCRIYQYECRCFKRSS